MGFPYPPIRLAEFRASSPKAIGGVFLPAAFDIFRSDCRRVLVSEPSLDDHTTDLLSRLTISFRHSY